MNPGAMKTRVEIWQEENTQAASGFSSVTRTLVHACRARRLDASTREVWEAYAAKARNVVNFEIRFHDGIRVGHWVECGGQKYEIIAVQRPEGLPRRMILKTTLKEAK